MSDKDEGRASPRRGNDADSEEKKSSPLFLPPLRVREKTEKDTSSVAPLNAPFAAIATTTAAVATLSSRSSGFSQLGKEETVAENEKSKDTERWRYSLGPRDKSSEDTINSTDSKGVKKRLFKRRGSTNKRSSSVFSKDLEELMMGVENEEDAPPNLLHLREALETSSSSDEGNIISISEKVAFPSEGKDASLSDFGWTEDPYNADGDHTPDGVPLHQFSGSAPFISTRQPSRQIVTRVGDMAQPDKGDFSLPCERWRASVRDTLLAEDSENNPSTASRSDSSPLRRGQQSSSSQRTLTDVPLDALISSETDDLRGTETASALSFPLRHMSATGSKHNNSPYSERPSEHTQGGKSSCEGDDALDAAAPHVSDGGTTTTTTTAAATKPESNFAEEAAPSTREYGEKKNSFKYKKSYTILIILIPFMLVAACIPASMYWSTSSVTQAIAERSLQEVNEHMQREIVSYIDYVALRPELMVRLMAASFGVSTLNTTLTPFALPSRKRMMETLCTAVMRTSLRHYISMLAYVSEDPNAEIAMCYRHNQSALYTLLPEPESSPPRYSKLYRVDPLTLEPQTTEPYYSAQRAFTSREFAYIAGLTPHYEQWREAARRDPGAVANVTLSKKLIPFSIYTFAFPFFEPGKNTVSYMAAMVHVRQALFRMRRTDNTEAFEKSRIMLLSFGRFHDTSTLGAPEHEDTKEELKDVYLVACNWGQCEEGRDPLWFLSADKKERLNPHVDEIEDALAKAALQQLDLITLTGVNCTTKSVPPSGEYFPRFNIRFGNLTNAEFAQYKVFVFEGERVSVSVLSLVSSSGTSYLLVLATPLSIVHTRTRNSGIFVGFTVVSTLLVILAVRYIITLYLHQPLVDICAQLEKAADFCETSTATTPTQQKTACAQKTGGTKLTGHFLAWIQKFFRWHIVLTEIDEVKKECDVLKRRMDDVRQYLPDEIFPHATDNADEVSSAVHEEPSDTNLSNPESDSGDEDENFGKDVYLFGQIIPRHRESAATAKSANSKGAQATKVNTLRGAGDKGMRVDHTRLTSQWLKSIHYMSNTKKKGPMSAHTTTDSSGKSHRTSNRDNSNTNSEGNHSTSFTRRPKALKLKKTQVQLSDVPAKSLHDDVPARSLASATDRPPTPKVSSSPDSAEEPVAAAADTSVSSPPSRQEENASGNSGGNDTAPAKSLSAFKLGIVEDSGTETPSDAPPTPRGSTAPSVLPLQPPRDAERASVGDGAQPEAAMAKNTFSYSKCFCTVVSLSLNLDRNHTAVKYIPIIEKLITDAATKFNGSIDIFAAEIFYVSFGSRRHMKDHALAATRFAIEILQHLTLDMIQYVTMVVDAGVYFTSIIGLPERKGFVTWGRPSAQLLRETQVLNGFHLLITEPTVLLVRNKFRLLPVDVCNMYEEPDAPNVSLYVIYKGNVKKKTWQAFSAEFLRFFKKVLAREFEEALNIVDHIYGSKYFPLFGLRFALLCAVRTLLDAPLAASSSAEERLRQLNEISVSYAQYLKSANILFCPMGFCLPSYIRLNVNGKGNNMLDMSVINYQLRFASPYQEAFLQSMTNSAGSWAPPEFEEPHSSETDDDAAIATVSNSMTSDKLLGAVTYIGKKEEVLDPVGEPHANLAGWTKKKFNYATEVFDVDTIPKAIPRFIEDNCQNVWRRSSSPFFDFKHPVFLCISQTGTLASMQVYDLPIRPDFWNRSSASASAMDAAAPCEEEPVAASRRSDNAASHPSFESTYARYFSNFIHENLVQYISVASIPRNSLVCIISEYVPGGTLERNSETYTRRLPLAAIKQYCISILHALDYLHVKKRIVHGRINPSNVLVGVDGHCKLKGMIYLFDWVWQTPTTPCALLKNMASYNAPEVNAGESRTPASDIYSFGLVLLGMLTWSPPWAWAKESAMCQSLADTLKDDVLFMNAYKANELELRTYDSDSFLSSMSGSSSLCLEDDAKGKDTVEDKAGALPRAPPDTWALDKVLQKVLQRSLGANPHNRKSASSLLRILSKTT